MDNQLQRCNIRFSSYVSGQGNNVSLRKVIRALIGGERDPAVLSRSVHGRTKNRHGAETVTGSPDGVINGTDTEMLTQCMEQTDLLEKQQARCLAIRQVGQVCIHKTTNRRAGYSRAKHCTATNTCGRFLSKYPGQPPGPARHF